MDISQTIKEYLPISAAFLGAFLAYVFGNRRYRSERFYKEATDSLKEFYSPLFYEMRSIKLDMNRYNKDKLIDDFLKKYLSTNTKLFMSFNAKLNDLFYDLDEMFRKYKLNKDVEALDTAVAIFNEIYYLVKKEFNDIQKSLYKRFPWYKHLYKQSFIIKFVLDLSVLLYETVSFLGMCWLLIIYVAIVNRITGQNDMPSIIKDNLKQVTLIIAPLFAIAITIRFPYFLAIMDYKKENKILKKANGMIFNKLKGIFKKVVKFINNK